VVLGTKKSSCLLDNGRQNILTQLFRGVRAMQTKCDIVKSKLGVDNPLFLKRESTETRKPLARLGIGRMGEVILAIYLWHLYFLDPYFLQRISSISKPVPGQSLHQTCGCQLYSWSFNVRVVQGTLQKKTATLPQRDDRIHRRGEHWSKTKETNCSRWRQKYLSDRSRGVFCTVACDSSCRWTCSNLQHSFW